MTTLIVTSSWPRTGDEAAGTFVRADAVARARAGEPVIVAAPRGPGVARDGAGVTIVEVPHGGLFGSPGASARATDNPLRLAGLAPYAVAIRRASARHAPSRIVAHWLLPAGLVACAVAPRGARIELIAHGGDVRLLEALPRPLARKCIESLCDRADLVRVVSRGLLDRLAAMHPGVRAKALVAPTPLALDDRAVAAQARARGAELRAGLAMNGLLHVVAARMVRDKPIARAIDHAARRRAPLALIGDGPDRSRLIAHAHDRGVRLHAPGAVPHEEALAWIAAADVLLAPIARGEGAPTAIREAQALGVPVIALA
jgi:glycosyltransferase involved in cell wall biosynthesis